MASLQTSLIRFRPILSRVGIIFDAFNILNLDQASINSHQPFSKDPDVTDSTISSCLSSQ